MLLDCSEDDILSIHHLQSSNILSIYQSSNLPIMTHDIIVVGAGPAGATAARTLARGGARVRLVDRARFPRNKPCGGAISMRALQRFPYLAAALDRISTRLISRLHLESPNGESVDLRSDGPAALMIRRVEFDELLVRLALDAGVELMEGVEITQVDCDRAISLVTRRGERMEASYVVAADGANSVIARRARYESRMAPFGRCA